MPRRPPNIGDTPLSEVQARAAVLLAEGKSYREVAAEVGVDHTTVWKWRTHDATFANAVKASQVDLGDLCHSLVDLAGRELRRRMEDEEQLAGMSEELLNRIAGTAADKLIAIKRIETPLQVEHSGSVATPTEVEDRRAAILERLRPKLLTG